MNNIDNIFYYVSAVNVKKHYLKIKLSNKTFNFKSTEN